MSIYFIIMFVALSILLGCIVDFDVAVFIVITAFTLMVFGGIAGFAFILSDGSHPTAITSGAILAPLIVFSLLWLFAKAVAAYDKSIAVTGRPAMSKYGVIVEAVEPRKAGLIELDDAIESGKVFPAISETPIPVGSRAMVCDLRRKGLIVIPVRS